MIDTTKILQAAQKYQFNRKNAENWDKQKDSDEVFEAIFEQNLKGANASAGCFFAKTAENKHFIVDISESKIIIGVFESMWDIFSDE